MPVVSCPQVPPLHCPARTAEGRCTRDTIVLEGPDAKCSYLAEQCRRRGELRVVEVLRAEKRGERVRDIFDFPRDEDNNLGGGGHE